MSKMAKTLQKANPKDLFDNKQDKQQFKAFKPQATDINGKQPSQLRHMMKPQISDFSDIDTEAEMEIFKEKDQLCKEFKKIKFGKEEREKMLQELIAPEDKVDQAKALFA